MRIVGLAPRYIRKSGRLASGMADTITPTCQSSPLLKRKGLAEKLDCSLRTIDALQAQGMPCVWLGRSRRFLPEEVIAWLRRKGGAA